MNMNVYSKRDLGEIMPGWFAVPQNSIVRGIAGLGQAMNCPSLEEFQGIVDPNDPCQASAIAAAAQTVGPTGGVTPVTCPTGSSPNFTQGTGATGYVCSPDITPASSVVNVMAPASTIAGIPTNYLIIGALAIGVLAMMKGGR